MDWRDPSLHVPEESSTSPGPIDAPNPKKRIRTACTRCKNRKQKCDDQLPICSSCLRVGATCDKADFANDERPSEYTRALEEEIAALEYILAKNGIRRSDQSREVDDCPGDQSTPLWNPRRSEQEATSSPVSESTRACSVTEPATQVRKSSTEDANALPVGHFEAPTYVGLSSGLSLAMNLGEIVYATVWKKAIPESKEFHGGSPKSSNPATLAQPRSTRERKRPMTMEELARHSVKEPPSDELGSAFLNTYFRHLHPIYPFLVPVDVWDLHHKRMDLSVIPSRNLDMSQRFSIFKLYMVYAIGATLLHLVEKKVPVPPESYYIMALQHISAAKESRTVQSIEAMALLAIHHLRSASGHGLWYIIGLAMRSCIDLGLHNKEYEHGLSPLQIQYRRRLFWSVYSLERTISISLGRPLSISDRQVDVEFPDPVLSNLDVSTPPSVTNLSGISQMTPITSEEDGGIHVAISLFQLRRIESNIHHSVYRTDRQLKELLPKLGKHRRHLEQWRASLIASMPMDSPRLNYPLMQYSRALCLLIQPFLGILPSSDPYYRLCIQSAGRICQAHKKMHQSMGHGHSFATVQNVFVAGATLVYSVWTHGKETWSVTLADDIRACSLVLFVMSDRAPWVSKYRDAFEMLVNAAMEKLKRDSSSDEDQGTEFDDQDTFPMETHDMREMQNPVDDLDYSAIGAVNTNTSRFLNPAPPGDSENSSVWRTVMDLANWIDPDQEEAVVGMPSFEDLQRMFE